MTTFLNGKNSMVDLQVLQIGTSSLSSIIMVTRTGFPNTIKHLVNVSVE